MPLETNGSDIFVLKVFPFRPNSFYGTANGFDLLPAPGGAYWGMWVGDNYQVVAFCKKPSGTPTAGSNYTLAPYLNDPVNLVIYDKSSDTYIELVVNRDSWFSSGWSDGSGWNEAFRVCPDF
jgi:hypothetical protein